MNQQDVLDAQVAVLTRRDQSGMTAVLITGTSEPDEIAAVMLALRSVRATETARSNLARWQARRRAALRNSSASQSRGWQRSVHV
jgi:hypothetical protein